jgi:polyphosphate kinase
MPGIRLHPSYHGYSLDDERFSRLLEMAAERDLIVHLVTWLDDESHAYLKPLIQPVILGPLVKSVASLNGLRLVVANAIRTTSDVSVSALARLPQIFFDFARLDSAVEFSDVMRLIPTERIVFGSCSPLMKLDVTISRLKQSKLTEDQQRAIRSESVRSLMAVTRD